MTVIGAEQGIGAHHVVAVVQQAEIVVDPPGAEVRLRIIDAEEHVRLAVGTSLAARVDITEYEAFWRYAVDKVYPMVLSRFRSHDPWWAEQPGDELRLEDLPAPVITDPDQRRQEAIDQVLVEAGMQSPRQQPATEAPPRPSYHPGTAERQILIDELTAISEELDALPAENETEHVRRQQMLLQTEREMIADVLDAFASDIPTLDAVLQPMVDAADVEPAIHEPDQAVAGEMRGPADQDVVPADPVTPSDQHIVDEASQIEPLDRVASMVPPPDEDDHVRSPVVATTPHAVSVRIVDSGLSWLVSYRGLLREGPAVTDDGHAVVIEALDGRFAVVRASFQPPVGAQVAIVQVLEDRGP